MRILENFKRKLRHEQRVRKMLAKPERVTAVYYVQQSHYNVNNWDAARIIAVALYDLGTGQETLFSLQHTLEQNDILEKSEQGDELERWMLDELQEAFADRIGNYFLYWSLRDGISGFHGIEQRYQYLGGKALNDKDGRISLSRTFSVLANENDFDRLLTYNQLWDEQLLTSQQELNAVREGNYAEMERSVKRKPYLMTELLQRLGDNTIKTDFNDSHWFNKTSVKLAATGLMALILVATSFFAINEFISSPSMNQPMVSFEDGTNVGIAPADFDARQNSKTSSAEQDPVEAPAPFDVPPMIGSNDEMPVEEEHQGLSPQEMAVMMEEESNQASAQLVQPTIENQMVSPTDASVMKQPVIFKADEAYGIQLKLDRSLSSRQ